jgi:large conductance mechanosensitive channel
MAMYQEFKKFIMRGNVVDLAVAVVIGAAFGKIVESLVKNIFTPLIGVMTGGLDLSKETVQLYGDARLGWGAFVQSVIDFVIIGFCMFLVVKGINRLKELQGTETPPPAELNTSEKLLTEIRDLLKAQKDPPPSTPAPTA